MLQMGSILQILDNTGVRYVRLIKVLNVSNRSVGYSGDTILASVIRLKRFKKIKKGEIHRVVIVGTRKSFVRHTGVRSEFDNNYGIIIDKKGNPLGTRILGPISENVLRRKFTRLVSLSLKTI